MSPHFQKDGAAGEHKRQSVPFIAHLGTPKDAVNKRRSTAIQIGGVRSVSHQAACSDKEPILIDRGQPVLCRQAEDGVAISGGRGRRYHNQAAVGLRREWIDPVHDVNGVDKWKLEQIPDIPEFLDRRQAAYVDLVGAE